VKPEGSEACLTMKMGTQADGDGDDNGYPKPEI
jgi:hypothetical protein